MGGAQSDGIKLSKDATDFMRWSFNVLGGRLLPLLIQQIFILYEYLLNEKDHAAYPRSKI
jgi:hypothetical protein